MLKKLKRQVELHGWVDIAYSLGHRDTWMLKKWIQRGAIPTNWKERVKKLLEKR